MLVSHFVAMIAFAKLQFRQMSRFQRERESDQHKLRQYMATVSHYLICRKAKSIGLLIISHMILEFIENITDFMNQVLNWLRSASYYWLLTTANLASGKAAS